MQNESPGIDSLKNKFLELFPDAEPGNNGSIKKFTELNKELHSITKGVGIHVPSGNLILKLTGNDAQDFIHRISTNDLKNLGVFKQRNTLFTNEKGRMIDRTTFFKIGDYILIVGSADLDKKLYAWLDKFLIMEDVKIEDVSDSFAVFEFYGNQVNSFMTMMCGENCADLNDDKITTGDFDSIKSYFTKVNEIGGIDKYIALVPHEDSFEFVDYLNNHHSAFDMNFIGDKTFNHFRIIKGIPGYPNEINSNYNPHDINLIEEVSFTKGCYIGQEVIARLDTYDKVQRKLMGVSLASDSDFELPKEIVDESNEVVGEITSMSNTELSDQLFGLALVRRKAIESDKKLSINLEEKKAGLKLIELPIEK